MLDRLGPYEPPTLQCCIVVLKAIALRAKSAIRQAIRFAAAAQQFGGGRHRKEKIFNRWGVFNPSR
jgi:hypothetical protein